MTETLTINDNVPTQIEYLVPGGVTVETVVVTEEEDNNEDDEDERGYNDDDVLDLLKEVIEKIYNDFEGPIDIHIRTDREDITATICRNDPIQVHFYTINAKQYFDDDRDHNECFEDHLVAGWINKPFEAEMLSRAFLEHILLNPERENAETETETERTES